MSEGNVHILFFSILTMMLFNLQFILRSSAILQYNLAELLRLTAWLNHA